jgi:zinc and cadmium transporter
LILLASLAGGWVPLLIRPTHVRLQTSTSFVAGLMLGVGLLHLLPHSWHQLRSMDQAVAWLVAGFLTVFFLQRFFHFHHHDVPEETQPASDHAQAQAHGHGACAHSLAEHSARRLSWTGATLGLVLHTLIDGVAVAASVQAEAHADGAHALAGLGTFLVVFLHKPFDAMAVSALMARGGQSRALCHLVNGLLALAIPAGALLFYLGLSQSAAGTGPFLGAALAFSAGTFLCISTSDLLPELQFHAHDRWKLSFALLAGLGLSALLGRFETAGHDRHHPGPTEETAPHIEH